MRRGLFSVILLGLLAGHLPGEDRAERARVEMAALAQALQMVMIDTGFFTTLENLDDLPGTVAPPHAHNGIDDGGGALVIRPARGVVQENRVNLTARPPGLAWQGPYMIYPRVDGPESAYDPFTPLDPWGTPYFLYTPLGRVSPREAAVTLDDYGDGFATYMLVSFGPDGVQSGDDLFFTVPAPAITEPAISSVRVRVERDRAISYRMTVRGVNFGAATGVLELDGVPVPIDGWTPGEVTARVSPRPREGVAVRLVLGDGVTELSTSGYRFEGAPASASPMWMVLE